MKLWPQRLNRIKWKLLATVATAVTLTMGISWVVFDVIVNRALTITLNQDVEKELKQGLQTHRDLFDAWKRTFRTACSGHARDHRLVEAVEYGDREHMEIVLLELMEEEPDAVVFTLVLDDESPPVEVSRDDALFPDDEWRRFDVSRNVGDTDVALTETWVVPWDRFRQFERKGEILGMYQAFMRTRDDIRLFSALFYIVTLGLVLAVVGGSTIMYGLRFGRRLNRLGRATERVGRGDLDVVVTDSVGDEITDLARDFNAMVREMRTGRERIEYLQRVSAWQEFARRLAHEIKNPLTPIQLAIQEIRSTYRGDDSRFRAVLDESYEIVEEEIAVLRRLTGEFSAFARLPRVTPREMEIAEFLAEATPALESYARSHDVRLECPSPPAGILVAIDVTMLRRVLDNLVHNAVEAIERASPEDGVVRIEVSERDPDVVIRVSDNGAGIDEENPEIIFAPYYTTRPEGTGLGLAIVKKVVLEHGGHLSVESTSTEGTDFAIRLPRL